MISGQFCNVFERSLYFNIFIFPKLFQIFWPESSFAKCYNGKCHLKRARLTGLHRFMDVGQIRFTVFTAAPKLNQEFPFYHILKVVSRPEVDNVANSQQSQPTCK